MSEVVLPAPKPTRSRFGTPRSAVIGGAGAGAGAGDGDGDEGADADVASVFVADDPPPPPPQAVTPALRRATATRRAWDVVFSAGGISSLSNEIVL